MMRPIAAATSFLLLLLAVQGQSRADDYFLTIGGGYSPTGNQISLEKNVLLFQQFVQEQYSGGARHDVYFADGGDSGPDIQFEDPDLEIPRVNQLLARVFRQTKYLKNRYRTHQVPQVKGATSRDNVAKWFDEVGSTLKEGDRLFIYVTAHGGKSTDKKAPYNTKLYLWNTQNVQMKEWVAHLNKVPDEVPVMSVMVQCYCGGFANILFNEGDTKKGVAKANRCGFFATTHTRPAAGCTPDINEKNYHEYSTYFWQAIRGQTRTGEAIERPDYDGDGDVSFAEAHAYALLTSTTVDISIKTSDAFLRALSKTKIDKPKKEPTKVAQAKPAEAKPEETKPEESNTEGKAETREDTAAPSEPAIVLLTSDSPFEELFELASLADRAVLEGLSLELGLEEPERAKQAKARTAELMKEKKGLDAQVRKKSAEYNTASNNIRKVLTNRWPELNNRWHPKTVDLLANHPEELVKLIESHADFPKIDKLRDELKKLTSDKLDIDRQWVKCQRLIRALENVALAANLPHVAPSEAQQRYQQLVAAEAGTFGPQKPSAAAQDKTADGK